jgi:hypothetical protein
MNFCFARRVLTSPINSDFVKLGANYHQGLAGQNAPKSSFFFFAIFIEFE